MILNIGNIMARGKEGADRELKQTIQCAVCKWKIRLRRFILLISTVKLYLVVFILFYDFM